MLLVEKLLGTSSAVASDPYFENVTMLLHGNGTNGAQNNTFLDSSSNNFTITRYGNTTQGSFSPYGSNWSNYFDGVGDYLQVADSSAWTFGSGDFTIEFWIYAVSIPNSLALLVNQNSGTQSTSSWDVRYDGTNVTGTMFVGGTEYAVSMSMSKNIWNHVAFVRSGNTTRIYVNGTSTTSTSVSGSVNDAALPVSIGNAPTAGSYHLNGYMSNVRIVKGAAVYTSNFTPSTTPLTAISNTQLLTCQSNRFIDNSTNAYTVTRTGDVSVQRFSPFSPTAAYSTATIGGSGYFDGSGDYFTVDNSGFSQSADFTFECWVYQTGLATVFLLANGRSNYAKLAINGSGYPYVDISNVGVLMTSNTIAQINTWNHIALVRSGSTAYLFLNGNQVASNSKSTWVSALGTLYLCAGDGAGENFNGYVCDMRFLSGTALYTGTTYTIPTAPLTAITNTSFLCNFTNGAIFDNAMMNDVETVGNAQISTAQSKFGGSSMYFDGTGDSLKFASNLNTLTIGSGDFTVEAWIYFSSFSTTPVIFDQRPASTNGNYPLLYLDTSGVPYWYVNSAARITGSALSTSAWYHIAVSRSGSSTKMFVGGTQAGSTYTDTTNYLYGFMAIGNASYDPSYSLNGYIDDFRFTKGYARYTANFTPPTAAFPDQ